MTEPDAESTTFADLALAPELQAALTQLGYEEPTPIQRESIPPLLEGRDLLGQAATGTGKTAAFALPLLQRRGRDAGDDPCALVLVPTRELAVQVSEAVHRYGRGLGIRVVPIYGGQPVSRQLRVLRAGVDVVVATPGRALDHIRRGTLRLGGLQTVVLDEADEMLDMGFAEDIEAILDGTPETRQTVLFSATMPPRIDKLARRHLRDAVHITMGREQPAEGRGPLVRQTAYVVPRSFKPAALGRILDVEAPAAAIVFCRTRDEVDELAVTLNGRGHRAEALHGGMTQEQRDQVMGRVRAGSTDLLVATDVAARGLDIDQLTHVVNYDVPAAPGAYVHRIGRVGRAGREGVAITLAEPREHRMLKAIERLIGQQITIEKMPTVADLHARRLEMTRAALEESLLSDDLERFRVVVDTLSGEFDVMEIALAAVKVAHDAGSGGDPVEDDGEIPDATVRSTSHERGRERDPSLNAKGRKKAGGPAPGAARLWISAGRLAGIRPQDIVGAITGESRVEGRDIGAIQISDGFSIVEVPEAAADHVVRALKGTKIKGKKTKVRRDKMV